MFHHLSKPFRFPLILLVSVTFLSVSGCGGGGSDESTSTSGSGTSTRTGSGDSGGGDTSGGDTLQIRNLNPSDYTAGTLDIDDTVYIDRSFVYTDVPTDYQSMSYIQTANDDKTSVGSSFVSFDINTNATIYVAYDARISPLPNWLSEWTNTGDSLITSDTTLNIYKKDFTTGTVVLGGNEVNGAGSMYVVLASNGTSGGGSSDTSGGDSGGSSGGGGTGTVSLSWTPPTTNEDGSTLGDLAGYRIYYGTSSGNYTQQINITNPSISTYVISELSPNTYYFVVTAYDFAGNESAYSNVASKTIE